MSRIKSKSLAFLGVGLMLGLLVGFGMMVGTYFALEMPEQESQAQLPPDIPPHILHAAAGTTGKAMAMATGAVYEEAEGVFILDFLTGQLYCWVPNPRNLSGGYLAVYKANVIDALGVEKGKAPDYILTTGMVQSQRGAGAPPANCVCYVADGNTGRVAMYGLIFDRALAKRGAPQKGELVLLGVAPARPEVEQEQ